LLHSGILSLRDRNPYAFLVALSRLKSSGVITKDQVEIVFRASNDDGALARQVENLGVEDLVSFQPPLPYKKALAEILDADGLLVFQGEECNRQIPAKLYEYIYARKPILSLAYPEGDTDRLVASIGIPTRACIDDAEEIKKQIGILLAHIRDGTYPKLDDNVVAQFSRRIGTEKLAALLEDAVSKPGLVAS